MLLSGEEIERAEETLGLLEIKGKVAVLAMVQNRVISMTHDKRYSDCQSCRHALENILEWIRFPLAEELAKLGSQAERKYLDIPLPLETKDLDDILIENSIASSNETLGNLTPEEQKEKAST